MRERRNGHAGGGGERLERRHRIDEQRVLRAPGELAVLRRDGHAAIVVTLPGWTTPRSPTASTPSRRCSSSRRRTRTRSAPTGARRRLIRGAARAGRRARARRAGCGSCAASARASRARLQRAAWRPGDDRRAGGARARARARADRARPLPRAEREALGRARRGARRQHAARSSARPPRPAGCATCPASGRRSRLQILEALARDGRAAPAARACCSTARASWSAASPTRSAASRPATRAAGATPASGSRSSARRADPAPGARALRRAAADRRGHRAAASGARRRDRRGRAGRARRRRAARASAPRCCARPARPPTSRRSSRSPTRPTRTAVYAALGIPWCPPELREAPFCGEPPALVELADIRGDLHCHTTWSDGRASVEEMGRAARERGYEYLAICDHTPAVGAVHGLTPDEVRRQAEEIAAANEVLAPFRVLRGIECDILPDGRLDLPTTCSPSSTGCRRASTAASGCRARDDAARRGGAAEPARALPEPPDRAGSSGAAPRTRSTSSASTRSRCEHGVAVEVNGLPPRLDLRGEHVREAIAAGVKIVCSTDSHARSGSPTWSSPCAPRAAAARRRRTVVTRSRTSLRPMTAILLYGDTIRYPAIRHEIPLEIIDPLLVAVENGRTSVLASSLESARIAETVPDAELVLLDELGFYEMLADGVAARRGGARGRPARRPAMGDRAAIVPPDLPVAVADKLRGAGDADRGRRQGRRGPPPRQDRRPSSRASAAPSTPPSAGWRPGAR